MVTVCSLRIITFYAHISCESFAVHVNFFIGNVTCSKKYIPHCNIIIEFQLVAIFWDNIFFQLNVTCPKFLLVSNDVKISCLGVRFS